MKHHVAPVPAALVPSLLLAGLLPLALATSTPAKAEPAQQDQKFVLVLDSSGSMKGKDPSGGTRMQAAQKALGAAVDALPEDSQVGLRVYGATIDVDKPTPASCADTQLVHPIAPRDVAALKKSIAGFTAKGDTPMAKALTEAIKDVGTDGKRHVVLVSDGEETCSKDPCGDVKKALAGTGVELQVDTVGFGVNDKARAQLQCIAEAGSGSYYDAKDAGQLTSTMTRLSTRAARAFTIQGTPAKGTPAPAGAPTVGVGQYTDTVASSPKAETLRHWRVKRQVQGSDLHVNLLGRARIIDGDFLDENDRSSWNFKLTTPDGKTECGTSWELGGDGLGFGKIFTGTVTSRSIDPLEEYPSDEQLACAAADELLFTLKLGKGTAETTPVELRVMEEPPAKDAGSLPKGVDDVFTDVELPSAAAKGATYRPAVGGASFNDAMPIEPGSYVTEVVPGEKVFFTAPLDWGQTADFSIDGYTPGFAPLQELDGTEYLWIAGDVYAPDFSQIDSQELHRGAMFTGSPARMTTSDTNRVPTVRYRNRWDSEEMYFGRSRGFSMAGNYYFSVGVASDNMGLEDLTGVPVPVRFSLSRDGKVTGAPTFLEGGAPVPGVTPTPSASPSPSASASPSASPAPVAEEKDGTGPLVGVGAVAALACIAGGVWLGMRRKG